MNGLWPVTSTLPLEILDLRHYSAGQLRPILEQESLVWAERLHWDYRASAELLLQYLDSRVLPGYVALDKGDVSGYVFCVYEESKAVIGDVFASIVRHEEPSAVDVENRLLHFLIELLQNSPGVTRIESQLLLHPHGSHEQVFAAGGFATHRRLFMEMELGPLQGTRPGAEARLPGNLAPGLEMRRWRETDFASAGRLISAAYEGHLDAEINDQYRTVAGSLRFLHNIVRFPGCGIFDPSSSFVITAPGQEQLAGLLLCSRIRKDVGHVTQLCVSKTYRGRGLATLMLQACAEELVAHGIDEVTLTVTEANAGAVSLYRAFGFHDKHSFDAVVWERRAAHAL